MLIENEMKAIPKPKVYNRQGTNCFYDSYRENLVPATPEEEVRQKLLIWLEEKMNVPRIAIKVEEHLSHYGIQSKDRPDILLHRVKANNELEVVAVIECKSNVVILADEVMEQAVGYADALVCDYVIVTNGILLRIFKYDEALNQYRELEQMPTYEGLLNGDVGAYVEFQKPPRFTFEQLSSPELHQEFIDSYIVGEATPHDLRTHCISLLDCLMDTDRMLAKNEGILFTIQEDKGIIYPTYGNASGYDFSAPYRCFLIKDRQDHDKLVSLGFNMYGEYKTMLAVGIQDYKKKHHALQLLADTYMTRTKNKVMFHHTGRIAVGHKGSGLSKAVVNKVASELPHLYSNGKINLGAISADKILMLDDPDVTELVINLIDYALLRDEYRDEMTGK